MAFAVGDNVKAKKELDFKGEKIAKGTNGTVQAVLESFDSYMVRFDGDDQDRTVPESDLEASDVAAKEGG